ncbi:MAG: hypothetical protein HY901_17070, partial [Deltaproteobacteria bacterium]|nr:hypothetical protein [Deltaproteobacteria bacterium]
MPNQKRHLFGRSLALFGLTTAMACAAPLLLAGATRIGAATGVGVAAVASMTALGLLALAIERGTKLVLGALAVGFLLR